MKSIRFLTVLLCLMGGLHVARAAEVASREDAMKLMDRARKIVQEEGPQALIDAVNNGERNLRDRDLYLYIGPSGEKAGLLWAHGAKPELVGKNFIDLRDQDGKYFVRELIATVTQNGSGWVNYRWQNPVTNKIEDKATYSEDIGSINVSVGIYRTGEPNRNAVRIISGDPSSSPTYLQIAHDLSVVLNDGDNLRIVPVVGIGGVQNIRDVRGLEGIDIGLTQSNILNNYRAYNRQQVGTAEEDKIVYIAKLFNEEIHIVARKEIQSIKQLEGKKVNIDQIGSGTAYAMRDIFRKSDINIREVNITQSDAFEEMKRGEIVASVIVAGKPVDTISKLRQEDGFHFLPVDYIADLQKDYLPTFLEAKDYPNMIDPGSPISSVAVSAVLISYNWSKQTDRYRRVEKFVKALFAKSDGFLEAPRHPKWKEVNLKASLPGWDRFDAVEPLLADNEGDRVPAAGNFGQFLNARGAVGELTRAQRERLFQEFMRWNSTSSN